MESIKFEMDGLRQKRKELKSQIDTIETELVGLNERYLVLKSKSIRLLAEER